MVTVGDAFDGQRTDVQETQWTDYFFEETLFEVSASEVSM